MSGDVYVSFGADTGELEAAMAKANAEVRALARELSSLASEAQKSGAAADSELGQRLADTAEQLAAAKSGVRDLKEEMRGVADAARGGEEAESIFGRLSAAFSGALAPLTEFKAAIGELAEVLAAVFAVEKLEQFVEGMAALGLETKKATEILGVSTKDVGALALVAKASGASLEQLETQFARFAKNISEETKNAKTALATLGLSFADLKGKSSLDQLEILADAFAKLPPGVERTAAAMEIFGRAGLQMLPMLAQGRAAIEDWRHTAEETGTALSEDTVAAMEATHRAATTLGAAFEGLGVAVYSEFSPPIDGAIVIMADLVESFRKAVAESGVVREAFDLIKAAVQALEIVLATTIATFKDLWDAAEATLDSIKSLFSSSGLGGEIGALEAGGAGVAVEGAAKAGAAWSKAGQETSAIWKRFHEQEDELNRKLQAEIATITGGEQKHGGEVKVTTDRLTEANRELERLVGGSDSWSGKLQDVQDRIDKITAALKEAASAQDQVGSQFGGYTPSAAGGMSFASTDELAAVIRAHEGFRSQAYWDVNHWRVGYGSDTTTDTSGVSHEVTASTTTTREDAERDLARRISEFANQAAAQVGEAWGRLGDRVKMSLTDMAYNYGRLPRDVAAAAQTGNSPQIAAAIRAHASDNGGVNAHLREAEAANIEGGGASSDQGKAAQAELSELEEKKRKLIDEQRKAQEELQGGTPRDKAELAAAEVKAKGAGDELKAKRDLVAADQQELAAAQSVEDKRKAQLKLDQDMASLRKGEAASKEADLQVPYAKAKAAGDPAAEKAAATALYDYKLAAAKAEYGAESAEYKRAEAEKESALRQAAETENRLTKMQVDDEIRQVKQAAEEKKKALDDALSHKRISSAQWLSDVNALDEQEKAQLAALYAKEQQLSDQTVAQKLAARQREAEELRKINQQETDDARKAADQTNKSFETAAQGILSSFTSAFKGMITGHETFRQAVTKAIEGVAEKFIDMIEKMVVRWLAGELAQTAATTTGVAARTATQTAGVAINAAANAAAALRSISTSAGEAFAGVFGFSAPLMGPAAAAPAAAAEAAVLSVGSGLVSADIGMWRAPSDMTALIHKNELVMPAAQAEAFRDMLSGGASVAASSPAQGASNVHLHVHAIDAGGVKDWFHSNARHVASALNLAVHNGDHHGLKTLGARR